VRSRWYKTILINWAVEGTKSDRHFTLLSPVYIGEVYCDNAGDSDKRQQQATLTIVLVLATLGSATQIGLFQFLLALPEVAKANTVVVPKVTVACPCC
jgi:hypothetical protein